MSDNEKKTEEQIVTKYDLKMQRRKEEKEREKREKNTSIAGLAIASVALTCFVASFPIRSYMTLHNSFVNVGGEDLTRVEFDYNYNVVKKNYIDSYSSYLSYFGLDTSKDLSTQMYDDSLTWEDYFQEMTVDNLVRSKALKQDAIKNGFTHDTTEEYNEFVEKLNKAAKDNGSSVNDYLKQLYGPLATLSRIEPYVKEALTVTAYYDKLTKDNYPNDEAIQAEYDMNKEEYDSVDYRIEEIYAELPTAPTELADPVDENEEVDENAPYEPSEAEIEKAMKEAKVKADASLKTIKTNGELKENVGHDTPVALVRDWLFDEARKPGDTTILEDEYSNKYMVVAFEKRYLDNTPTANVRVLMTTEDGTAYMDQWKSGAATEDTFADLCTQYSLDKSTKGGLYEHIAKSGLNENLSAWLFDEARNPGDAEIIKVDETYTYIVYYVSQDIPNWQISIQESISSEAMTDYVEGIKETCEVKDDKNNLPYIKKREEQKAAEEAEAAAEGEDDGEDAEVIELEPEEVEGDEIEVEAE